MTRLHCRSIDLDRDVDLNDIARDDGVLFVKDGFGIAGRGVAVSVESSRLVETLKGVGTKGPSDIPIAIGALPFSPDSPGRFIVPSVTVVKNPTGAARLIVVGDESAVTDEAMEASRDDVSVDAKSVGATASTYSVGPITPVDTYLRAVTAARDAVRSGEITKAVIARDIRVESSDPIDIHSVLLRLKASFGSSYRYRFGNLIGASPELLVEVDGSTVRSNPLAGTTARTGDPATDQRLAAALLASEKNQIEHRVVVDMVHDTLLPYCSYLDWEPDASVVAVANVQHLGTRVEGRLNSETHVVDLARRLCPTPALGGYPRTAAVELIQRVEGMDRGLYGGGIGWCDARGNGTFAVTIRCAEFSSDRRSARLFAGGGIVADSEPLSELAETQAKFQAMLSALIRP